MSASRLLFQALVGLVSTGTIVHSAVRSAPAQAADSDDASSSSESAIFARYSELDSADTESRLKELTGDDTLYESMVSLNKALASGASSKEIEKTVLTLVEKSKTADADTTLAAILLDYYESYLQDDLTSGAMTPAEAFKDLDDQNDALTEATYGSNWRTNKTYRKRHVRR